VVPTSVEAQLFAEFSTLLKRWSPTGTEIKGSKLDEAQAATLIELVSRYEVFVDFFAVDMATHGENVVSAFKESQATGVSWPS
jgi:hypothetical protein